MDVTNGDVANTAADSGDSGSSFTGGTSSNSDSGNSGNPAWGEILNVLPTSLHPVVTPQLQKWDNGVNARFEQVQSQYAPYKAFVEKSIDPSMIENSLALYNLLNTNPRAVYDRMTEHYADEWGLSGQGQQPNDDADDYSLDDEDEDTSFNIENHPEFQRLQQQQQVMAGFLENQIRQETEAKAQQEVQSELAALTSPQRYGELSQKEERFILSLALQNNMSLEQAAVEYFGGTQRQAAGASIPPVMGTNGGVPLAQHVNPSQLSRKDTRSLVAQFLQNANNPNNQ